MTLHHRPEFAQGAAIVVGGSGGIGAAICQDLARAGSDLALTYNTNADKAASVAASIEAEGRRALTAKVDLRDAEAVRAFVDDVVVRFGSIHSVVYAAGPALKMAYIADISPEVWARTLGTDIEGCFNLVSVTLPHLRARGGGAYVAVVTGAVDRPPPRDIMSAAPKAAIQALMRGLAKEEGRNGIRANCVGPGWIDTGLGSLVMAQQDQADYIARFTRAIPLKRIGQAEEVASVTTFLLSEAARYVTGVTIPAAGGLQL